MLEIFVTEEFQIRYKNLPKIIQKKAEKQERIFKQNQFHPSLHTEKLAPKNKELWSFRVDINYRILFRFINGNKAVLMTVGHHNWIYKFKL